MLNKTVLGGAPRPSRVAGTPIIGVTIPDPDSDPDDDPEGLIYDGWVLTFYSPFIYVTYVFVPAVT